MTQQTPSPYSPNPLIDREAVAEMQDAASPEDLLTLVVEAFGALADPMRARILYAIIYALIPRPQCVPVCWFGLSRSTFVPANFKDAMLEKRSIIVLVAVPPRATASASALLPWIAADMLYLMC